MKWRYNFIGLISLLALPFMALYLTVCFPDRVPTDPDFKARDVRRPAVAHHVPLKGSNGVSRSTTITIWFDELMDQLSVQNNFLVWPSVKVDSVQAIAIDPSNPDIIYAAKHGKGIFKSEDGAESWHWLTPEFMHMRITDLVVSSGNSNLLYAATADSGVYKSLDGGSAWQQISGGLPEMNVLAIAVDPNNDDIIYAAMNSTGIYKSDDGGLSWNAKNNGVKPGRGPRDIVMNPLDSNTLYAPTGGDFILKSVDGGESWTRLRTGLFTFYFNTIAIHPKDTSLVFSGSDGGGMYKSEDGGSSWTMINSGLTDLVIQSIVLHSQDTNKVVISTPSGVFKSLDEGQNWFATGDIPAENAVSMLVIHPTEPERIYAATTAGVYRSEDLANSWLEKNNLPLEYLYIAGSFDFETWQDTITIIAPKDSVTMDTTVIFPYIYERALSAWIAGGRQGEPPVEANPAATKMIFTPNKALPPNCGIQVRIKGTFESDRETIRNTYGAKDIHGNSFEVDYNFTFTTGKK